MDHIRITKIIVTLLFVGALCACQLSQTPTEVNSSSSINQKPEVSETVDKQRVEFQIDGNSYEITEIQHSNQLPPNCMPNTCQNVDQLLLIPHQEHDGVIIWYKSSSTQGQQTCPLTELQEYLIFSDKTRSQASFAGFTDNKCYIAFVIPKSERNYKLFFSNHSFIEVKDDTPLTASAPNMASRLVVTSGQSLEWSSAHNSNGYTPSVAFSPNGKLVAASSWDGIIPIWDMTNNKLIHKLEAERVNDIGMRMDQVVFSPDGTKIATGSWYGAVWVWKLPEGTLIGNFQIDKRIDAHVIDLAFSSDGTKIAVQTYDGITLLNIQDGSIYRTFAPEAFLGLSFEISPKGDLLAVYGRNVLENKGDGITLWQIVEDKVLSTLYDESTGIYSHVVGPLSFSPDGKSLAVGTSIVIWDIENGELLRRFEEHTDLVNLTFSPDGSMIASVSGDGNIWLWNTDDGTPLSVIDNSQVTSVAFSPDGKTLIAGSNNSNTVKVWKIK